MFQITPRERKLSHDYNSNCDIVVSWSNCIQRHKCTNIEGDTRILSCMRQYEETGHPNSMVTKYIWKGNYNKYHKNNLIKQLLNWVIMTIKFCQTGVDQGHYRVEWGLIVRKLYPMAKLSLNLPGEPSRLIRFRFRIYQPFVPIRTK